MDQQEQMIRQIVKASVIQYAQWFSDRHLSEYDDDQGTLNMKIHNVFIAKLGPEIQFFSALSRSLDSSLGNMLEKMAIMIAELNYDVASRVEGPLYPAQTSYIAELLEKYKRHEIKPQVTDYNEKMKQLRTTEILQTKRHESDYYLVDKETEKKYLIELKIGWDLDNKKARSEKEALLEQYAILSNTCDDEVHIYFATAYNRYWENKEWKQERVKQFFSKDELLIWKDFWNFICKSDLGYQIVIDEYEKNADHIIQALAKIKNTYLS